MAPDVRSSTGGSSFDFNSQAGVLAVLGAIRSSELSHSERNELRDVVFLYSNGGGDPAVRTVLEERLRSSGITTASIPVKKTDVAKGSNTVVMKGAGFSGGRPVPVFAPVMPQPVPVVKKMEPVLVAPAVSVPAPTPAPIVPSRPVVAIPRPVAVPMSPRQDAVASVPVVSVPRIVPTVPTMPIAQVPVPVQTQSVAEAVSVPVAVVPPVAIPPVSPNEVSNPAATARLERIRQIKSDINSRVGNPVNLVDLDNALGREYMAALLEAMKLIADAPEADANRAMTRLDAVYSRALTLLDRGVEAMVPADAAATASVPVSPIVPIMPTVPTPPQASVVPPVPVPIPLPTVKSEAWGEMAVATEVPVASTPVPVRVIPSAPVVPSVTVVPAAPTSVQSVAASQAPLRSLAELPTADEVNSVSANGDPLYTGEVDAGLQQLLSEWSLFKKSGLFGTGPSGREHPLFLKLAPLQLPLLLAGRFEGSTQDIKQSIADYMNGWRYEQGIVYEKNETFEQYLRRVIRHIIDLQNKKRGA